MKIDLKCDNIKLIRLGKDKDMMIHDGKIYRVITFNDMDYQCSNCHFLPNCTEIPVDTYIKFNGIKNKQVLFVSLCDMYQGITEYLRPLFQPINFSDLSPYLSRYLTKVNESDVLVKDYFTVFENTHNIFNKFLVIDRSLYKYKGGDCRKCDFMGCVSVLSVSNICRLLRVHRGSLVTLCGAPIDSIDSSVTNSIKKIL